ncbi:MAG: NUDIX domain-containing protein [Chloroflexota bacterium]
MQRARNGLMRLAYQVLRLKWFLLRPVTVGVRIMLIQNDEVVLLKQTYLPDWHFPGGMVDRGETMAEAAEREAAEEVGATCHTPPRLFGIFFNYTEWKSDHVGVFLCEDFTLQPSSDRWEVQSIERFPIHELPADASRGSHRRIAEYMRGEIGLTGQW